MRREPTQRHRLLLRMRINRPRPPPRLHASQTLRAAAVLTAVLLVLGPLTPPAQAQRGQIEPEIGTGRETKTLSTAHRHMVAAAHPLAAEAGLEMLRAGGTATDAAIATQLVLGLVEPQSSGLGGGAFLLHWDAASRKLDSYDGRETAPAAARPDRFPQGRPFDDIVASGLGIGVPGVPRLLEAIHKKHGRLPWPRLFEPAIRLAEDGFQVSPRLNAGLTAMGAQRFSPAARRQFFAPDGTAWPVGHRLRNPDYAATLLALATEGAAAFYQGPIASAILAAGRDAPHAPSDMSTDDLASYRVIERAPVCFDYRERRICSMGPPSSGGPALAQILGLIEPFDLGRGRGAALAPHALHLIAEAEKLAYADRDRFIADPGFVTIPTGLLDPGYLATRRHLIMPDRAMPKPSAGQPPGLGRRAMGEDSTLELSGTSHLSIVDGMGNAVSMTTTIEAAFGSRVWAAGFLLNNQLTDFSIRPTDGDGRPVANAVGPGQRPRSSMAPTIMFDPGGRLSAVLGSPGGSRIILYVAKALVALIDWRMDPQAAAGLVNFGSRGGPFEIETVGSAVGHALKLRARGHEVRFDQMTSGLHIITIKDGRLLGGADPRREGVAVGE